MNRRALSSVAVLVGLVAAACGSSSPSSPSGAQAVTIQGVVLGGSGVAPLTAQGNGPQASATSGAVTVTVAGTSHGTTVSATGTFGLATDAGSFTLVFKRDGSDVGTIDITATGGAQVSVVVQISQHTLTVVGVTVHNQGETDNGGSCLINGGKANEGIQLEGNALAPLAGDHFMMTVNGNRSGVPADVNASAATFKCNGAKGKTQDECKAMLQAGSKVHVSGTLMSCTANPAPVTATEVKLQ